MARQTEGTIQISRRIFGGDKQNSDFYGDPALAIIWMTLIAWANWQDGTTAPNGSTNPIKRGQVLTSVPELAGAWGLGAKIVRRCLKTLEMGRRIDQQATNRGRVITILKYDAWQLTPNYWTDEGQAKGQAEGRQRAGRGQAEGTHKNTSNTGIQEYRNTKESPDKPADVAGRRLGELWNQHKAPCQPSIDLKRCKATGKTLKQATARLREEPDPEYWTTVIKRIAASKGCRGENDRGWIADFHFLVREETHLKVMQGKYDSWGERVQNGRSQDLPPGYVQSRPADEVDL